MSHMNELCHIWMRHVTRKCVMSRKNESCRVRMRHATHKWALSHLNEFARYRVWMIMTRVSALQCVACVAVCCSVLRCAAVCCSVLQCVAVCCSRIAYEWVVLNKNDRVTFACVMSCHTWLRHHLTPDLFETSRSCVPCLVCGVCVGIWVCGCLCVC